MNYIEDIRIDEQILDVEWLEQADKTMTYCIQQADAMRTLEYAKEKLDITKAERDKDIRSNPEKYGISKITETVVENTIIIQADYIAANHAMIEAKYEYEMAKNAVKAFDQRKDALEALVKLHGQSYFSGPKVPHDISKERSTWKKQDNPKIVPPESMRRGK